MTYIKRLMFSAQKSSKSIILSSLNKQNIFLSIIIPYLIFIILNLALADMGVIGFLIMLFLDLVVCLCLCVRKSNREKIIETIEKINAGDLSQKVVTKNLWTDNLKLAKSVNSIGEVINNAVEASMKDEKLKADLITNVSHDLKTPLTSIINYVELIKREKIDNTRVCTYLEVLETKSFKLKKLTEDLLEASKITSGNIRVELKRINLVEFINQTIGEYYERFEEAKLMPVFGHEEQEVYIVADPGLLWRVIDNLFGNACKYGLPGTNISITLSKYDGKIRIIIANVSKMNIGLEDYELEERFMRGDVSRSTEGTGLGLAIAKSLTKAQGAEFRLKTSGDLFKCIITF